MRTGDISLHAMRGCFGRVSRAHTLRAAAMRLAARPYRHRPFSVWRLIFANAEAGDWTLAAPARTGDG